jgi:hypothetical protein
LSVTESLSKVGDWFGDKISGAWEWTKEKAAAFWDWLTKICSKMAEVVIDTMSTAWEWVKKYKEYIAFAGVLILGIVLCIFATPLGRAVLSGMLSFVISMALNGWEINKMTFLEVAIGGILGLVGGGITAGASRGLASGIGQKLIMGAKNSKVLGPVLRGGQKLVSKLPAPLQKMFGKGGAIGAVEGAGTSVADDILHGRKINWKNAILAGIFGAGSVAVVHFAQPAINKAVASLEPVLAKTPIVKNVFNKVGDCVAVRQTGRYHALIDIPFSNCFHAPDGVTSGGNSSSAKPLSLEQRRENVKHIAEYTDLSKEGLKGKGYKLKNGAIIKGQKIVKVNSIEKYRKAEGKLSLEYVAKLRKELGIPSLKEDNLLIENDILKSGNTVAVLESDGVQIWGRSGWGIDVGGYSELRKEWAKEK